MKILNYRFEIVRNTKGLEGLTIDADSPYEVLFDLANIPKFPMASKPSRKSSAVNGNLTNSAGIDVLAWVMRI